MNAVSLVGLGAMGQALAEAFIHAGHKVTVWNLPASGAEAIEEKGVTQTQSLAEAVQASPVTIMCLLDYSEVRDTIYPVAELLSGKVLINLTNGPAPQAREMSDWARRNNIDYIDGRIMATPSIIGKDDAYVFYGGCDQDFLETQKPMLESLGKVTFAGIEPGAASLMRDSVLSGQRFRW